MSKLSNYNSFLLEKSFQKIIDDIFRLVESEDTWTSDNTYEWDLSNNDNTNTFEWDITKEVEIKSKLKSFLSKLSKDKIKDYFYRLIDGIKSLPISIRKKLIFSYVGIFLLFTSAGSLFPENSTMSSKIPEVVKSEVVDILNISNKKEVDLKSSFEKAQSIVKEVEAGYSDDRGDSGNWIKVPGGRRFVGTNHGISAPILADYLGRLPKRSDMESLPYETAVKIYKDKFWNSNNIQEFINQSVANIVYDGAVNQGEAGIRDVLRKSLNDNGVHITDDDNPFDIGWIKKINTLDQKSFFKSVFKFREERYKGSRTFKRHGDGWLNRLYSINFEK